MRRHFLPGLVLLGLIAFPFYAWANAGTPLMWAELFHLVLGNALIGVGEGLLLAWLFSVPKLKSVLVMIPANYASAWLGYIIRGAMVHALSIDLNNGWKWFWFMVVVTYVMTLIIEWPFVAWCLRGTQDWLKRSLKASLVVQSASYFVLFGGYWMVSDTSLYTKMNIVLPGDLSLPDSVFVYFIGSADGNVYKRQLVGRGEEMIYQLHSEDDNDRLFVRRNRSDTNRWDLVARLESQNRHDSRFVDVLTNLLVEATTDWRSLDTEPSYHEGTLFNFGEVQSLGSATNSPWKFQSGLYSVEGLWGSNKTTSQSVQFSYETPFSAWIVRNAVHLPSDEVLFQLGNDQICMFDPVNRQVALLWHGRGPVAVIEKTHLEQNGAANRNHK